MHRSRIDQALLNPSRRTALKALTALLAMSGMRQLAAEPTTVRINIPGPMLMPFFPVELIPKLAIDTQFGTRLGIRYHPTGVLALEDMLAGNADFACAGFPVLPKFLQKGKAMVAVASLSSGAPPYAIIVRKDLDSIRSLADLRGHTLGVPVGSATTKTYLQLVAELWVAGHGVAVEQVRWAPITQTYEGVYGAMASETVDAVFCEEPYSTSLVRAGLGRVLARLSDEDNPLKLAGKQHLRAVVVTTPERINADPERVRVMTQMLRRSLQWIGSNSVADMVTRLDINNADQRQDIIDALTHLPAIYSQDGRFTAAELASTREFLQTIGTSLSAGKTISDLIDDRWIRQDR